MTAKNMYWLANAAGERAVVTGKEDRDRWVGGFGWSDAAEPVDGEQVQVWMQHTEHGGRARFPLAVAATWRALGWEFSAPPEPPDVLHDQHLVDEQPADPAPAAAKPAASTAAPTVSATAGDDKKEKDRG